MPKKSTTRETPGLAHQPFAQLGGRLAPVAALEPDTASSVPPAVPARAVIRLERKGRRGKEVTIVEQLGLDPGQADEWLHALKSALGCGGTAKDGAWVLQGDQRLRVREWLQERGVKGASVSG